MRTIKIATEVVVDATTKLIISTEVMIGDDQEAESSGIAARAAIDAFVEGYAATP